MAQKIMPLGWRKKTPSAAVGPLREAFGSGERKQDGKTLKVATLHSLIYTPTEVNEIPFCCCIVDTGSQANVIFVRNASMGLPISQEESNAWRVSMDLLILFVAW